MSTIVSTEGLTKEDVSYLRRADDVYAINIEGQNFLRVVKRGTFGDAFSEDKRVDLPVPGNGKHGYFTSAWEFPWRTLRAGDRVRLYWYPDANTNELLRQVGLHADVLFLDVARGKQENRYVAGTSVCADNSARMCRSDPGSSFG
jgi:hypothetical protein